MFNKLLGELSTPAFKSKRSMFLFVILMLDPKTKWLAESQKAMFVYSMFSVEMFPSVKLGGQLPLPTSVYSHSSSVPHFNNETEVPLWFPVFSLPHYPALFSSLTHEMNSLGSARRTFSSWS